MKKQWFAITLTVATATTALLVLFWLMGDTGFGISTPALAAPLSLTVTAVDPAVAPNDLDTPIIITGTGFAAELSGTLVITQPTAYLGTTALDDVSWVSTTTLSATVPWGFAPKVYSLTVVNPDGISATLQNAFTVTNGIGVFTTGGPYGGYVVGVEKKPGTPTTVYALAMDVGLFVSGNSGGAWELVYPIDYMSRLVFDSQDADVMYLGAWRSDQFARSLDGGQTWETPPQIPFPYPGHGNSSYPATHPTDAGKVFLGIGHAFGELPPGEGGIYRSDDYGMTWMTKTNGMTDTQVQAIAIHPNDPDKMLAGTWKGNVYASLDGGENWSLNAHLHDPVAGVYFNPYQPLEAWAATGGDLTSNLYTSTNLTAWTEVIVEPGTVAPWPVYWHVEFLTDTLWVSGSGIFTSTDSGTTWTKLTNTHGDVNIIEISAENPQEIYVGHGRGVDKSNDGSQTWQEINNGLAGLTPDMIAVPQSESDTVYVHTSNGLFRSFNGGRAWQDLDYGGGGGAWGDWLVADPYTPTRIYLGGSCNDDQFCLEISPDSGETWVIVTTTLPITYAGWESAAYALAPHPQIPGRILAGNWVWHPDSAPWLKDTLAVVYASDDYGQSWAYMGPTQPISAIMDIAYDAVDPNLVYMATAGSGHWKSTDGGATWQVLPFTRAGDNGDEIAPHPTLSGHLILATSDQNGSALYSSQDAGETWTFLTNAVNSPLVYAPTFPPTLYATDTTFWTETGGLYRSFDNGKTWALVEGAPVPIRLATATDGERVVLYIGSAGGMVSQVGVQTTSIPNTISGDVTIFGGGVYRLTTLLPTDWVYLPLVVRGYAP